MKRMQHPEHGFHNAMTDAEEVFLRSVGWIEDDGKALKEKLAKLSQVEEVTDKEFIDTIKRRGRNPSK
jgi:hypothetical protein